MKNSLHCTGFSAIISTFCLGLSGLPYSASFVCRGLKSFCAFFAKISFVLLYSCSYLLLLFFSSINLPPGNLFVMAHNSCQCLYCDFLKPCSEIIAAALSRFLVEYVHLITKYLKKIQHISHHTLNSTVSTLQCTEEYTKYNTLYCSNEYYIKCNTLHYTCFTFL